MPQILMCPPTHYGIEYEINPWMNRARQADHGLATEQWHALHEILVKAGAQTSLLEPVQGLPDLVFTANAGLVYKNRVIVSRFRYSQRQAEEPVFDKWFVEHGYQVEYVPENFSFEGAGDALFCGDTLWAGYRMRSDAGGHQAIGRLLGVRVIPVELVDARYYHLDTCFCPLASGLAIYYPHAFDEYGRRALAAGIEDLIPVDTASAERFACNAVVVGKTVITNTGCESLHAELRQRGFCPIATPLDEFVKAGGSAKCLTLRLDGEEAAAWRA
jgi:N-dimethylarginine dimethylaminohydrolase